MYDRLDFNLLLIDPHIIIISRFNRNRVHIVFIVYNVLAINVTATTINVQHY